MMPFCPTLPASSLLRGRVAALHEDSGPAISQLTFPAQQLEMHYNVSLLVFFFFRVYVPGVYGRARTTVSVPLHKRLVLMTPGLPGEIENN